MMDFSGFLSNISEINSNQALSDIEKARHALWLIARFLYFKTNDVPTDHISAFHAWWENNAEQVLGIFIDDVQCRNVARVLEHHFSQTETRADAPPSGLLPEAIANVRFFSAAQDFGGRFRNNPFELALTNPKFFNPQEMLDKPSQVDDFLRYIGAEAQYDKRRDFVRNGAKWLIENFGGQALNLFEVSGNSVRKLSREMTASTLGMGFSAKKTHMFVRDMFDWGVWESAADIEDLDIAADANTMRIALRTGILRLTIPTLVPSYMDIHSYQYSLMDRMTVAAWRRVWEVWRDIPDNHRVSAPAFFDFFIYTLGKTTCKKSTPRCLATNDCSKNGKEDCPAFGSNVCNGHCPFREICPSELKALQPPKSISILGRTGWVSGATNEGGGLGITA